MMHKQRIWQITPAENASALARQLTEQTWCLCTAFELGGYLFLNDATSEDGAQEYAVVKRLPDGRYLQVESITFSWCRYERARQHIVATLIGQYDHEDFVVEVHPRLQSSAEHGACPHCA